MTTDDSNRLFELDAIEAPTIEVGSPGCAGFQSLGPRAGADFKEMAIRRVVEAGGTVERTDLEIEDIPVDALIRGANGRGFLILARGTPYEHSQSGLRKTDTLEKAGFRAVQLARCQDLPVLFVASDLPERTSKAGRYLAKLDGDLWDAVAYRADLRGYHRLQDALIGPPDALPPAAPWRAPLRDDTPNLLDLIPAESDPAQGRPSSVIETRG